MNLIHRFTARTRAFATMLILSVLSVVASAQTATLESEATDAITDLKATQTTILIAVMALVVGLVAFKIIRRALNKA